jgi:hypothetical protein
MQMDRTTAEKRRPNNETIFVTEHPQARVKRQLEIFACRCLDYSDEVAAGKLDFLDAVDVCQDAAVASGLAASVGMDVVQAVMCSAFANARPRP